jgi:hypothetical protein
MSTMNDRQTYLFIWLLPCCFSFTSSCLVMANVIFTEGLLVQLFQQIALMLAISDVIQTSPTFLGDYGDYRNSERASYTKCCIQNYTLQFGVMFKTSILVYIGGIVWHIVKRLSVPNQKHYLLGCTILPPIIFTSVSIVFQTADVYCVESYDFSEESSERQLSYIMLVGVFFLPLYIQLITLMLYCFAVKVKMSRMQICNPGVQLLLSRMMLYPIVFLLALAPATLTLITQFVLDRSLPALDMVTGFFISFNGFLLNFVYIHHQKQFPHVVMAVWQWLGLSCLPTTNSSTAQEPLLTDGATLSFVYRSSTSSSNLSFITNSTVTAPVANFITTARSSGDQESIRDSDQSNL